MIVSVIIVATKIESRVRIVSPDSGNIRTEFGVPITPPAEWGSQSAAELLSDDPDLIIASFIPVRAAIEGPDHIELTGVATPSNVITSFEVFTPA